jgi:hypothetical protein
MGGSRWNADECWGSAGPKCPTPVSRQNVVSVDREPGCLDPSGDSTIGDHLDRGSATRSTSFAVFHPSKQRAFFFLKIVHRENYPRITDGLLTPGVVKSRTFHTCYPLSKLPPGLKGLFGLIPASKGPDEKMVEFVGFRLLRLPLSRYQRPHPRQVHTKLPGSPGLSIGNQRRREILGHRWQRRCQGTIQICSGGFSEQFLPSSDAAAGPPSVGFRGLGTSRWTIADSPRTV